MATAENQKWQESLPSFVCGSKSVKDNQLTEFLATHQLQQQQQQDDSRLIATKKRGSLKPLIAVSSSVQHCQPLRNCALPWLEWPGLNVSGGFASHVSGLCQESPTRFSSPHCTQTLPAPFYCSEEQSWGRCHLWTKLSSCTLMVHFSVFILILYPFIILTK